MFYRRGFLLSLFGSCALSIMAFVAAVLLGPLLLQSVGAGTGRFGAAVLTFVARVVVAAFVAAEMSSKRAPLRRVLANVVPGTCLGWALPVAGLSGLGFATGQSAGEAVAGFAVNLVAAAVAALAGCLLGRRGRLGPPLGLGAQDAAPHS